MKIDSYITLLRPQQWIKNVFVLLPVFFGQQLTSWPALRGALLMVVAFCLASGGIYCLNDLCDADADRLHPQKRLRPIASGRVSRRSAIMLMGVCWALAMLVSFSIFHFSLFPAIEMAGYHCQAPLGLPSIHFSLFTFHLSLSSFLVPLYIFLNILYSLWLKHIAGLDLLCISCGFVLRVLAGGAAAGIVVSGWLLTMTLLLTLFIALGKRRDEMAVYGMTGVKPRRNIGSYRPEWVNPALVVLALTVLICYVAYTLSDEVLERLHYPYLYTTSIYVAAAIGRYLYVIVRPSALTYSPTRILLHDRWLQITLAVWLINFALILY